jgi:hypothetical protein
MLGAAFSGAATVDHGHASASMAVAVLAGVALPCLWVPKTYATR